MCRRGRGSRSPPPAVLVRTCVRTRTTVHLPSDKTSTTSAELCGRAVETASERSVDSPRALSHPLLPAPGRVVGQHHARTLRHHHRPPAEPAARACRVGAGARPSARARSARPGRGRARCTQRPRRGPGHLRLRPRGPGRGRPRAAQQRRPLRPGPGRGRDMPRDRLRRRSPTHVDAQHAVGATAADGAPARACRRGRPAPALDPVVGGGRRRPPVPRRDLAAADRGEGASVGPVLLHLPRAGARRVGDETCRLPRLRGDLRARDDRRTWPRVAARRARGRPPAHAPRAGRGGSPHPRPPRAARDPTGILGP
jgi:hypothetical protein